MRNLRISARGIALVLAFLLSFIVVTVSQPRVVEASSPENFQVNASSDDALRRLTPSGFGLTELDIMAGRTSPFTKVVSASPDPDWWNGNWQYRKLITLTVHPDNYQIKIVLDKVDNLNSHCLDNFQDLRFTENDNGPELSYWIENYISGDNAVVWVRRVENDDNQIYVYYGNPNAPNTSSGDNTFPFFDDFSSRSISPSYSVLINTTTYDAFGFLLKSSNDNLLYICRQSTAHATGNGKMVKATYTISTNTWSSFSTIYDSTYDDGRGQGGGAVDNKIFVFFTRHVVTGESFFDTGYIKSTDNGNSWSGYTTIDISPLEWGGPYGGTFKMGDNYYQPFYGENGATHYVKMFKSTDNGATWAVGPTIYSGADSYSETFVEYLGNGKLIALMRLDSYDNVKQSTSSDYGNTWSAPVKTNLAKGTLSNMSWILSDNDKLIVIFGDRSDKTIHIAQGVPATVFSNPTSWENDRILYSGGTNDVAYPSIAKRDSENYYVIWSFETSSSDADTYGGYLSVTYSAAKWKWSGDSQYATISDGILDFQYTSAANLNIVSSTISGDIALRAYSKIGGGTKSTCQGILGFWKGYNDYTLRAEQNIYNQGANVETITRNAGTTTEIITNWTYNAWKTIDLRLLKGTSLRWFENEVELDNSPTTDTIPAADVCVVISSYNTEHVYVDWILVRKYVSPEPTLTLGNEENAPVNIAPEVLNIYIQTPDNTPDNTLDVDTWYKFKVEMRDNNNLSDVKEVQLKLYENTLNYNSPDNTRNHYTFKWTKDWNQGFVETRTFLKSPQVQLFNVDIPTIEEADYVISKEDSVYYARLGDGGSIGYSGSDATVVINSAIENRSNGGVIFFKSGTYTLTSNIECDFDNNISFIGENVKTTVLEATSSNAIEMYQVENMLVTGFRFKGHYYNGVKVRDYYTNSINVTIYGNIFDNCSNSVYSMYTDNLFIVSNDIHNDYAAPIQFDSCENVYILNNWIENSGNDGVGAYFTSYVYIEGNIVRNSMNTGLWIDNLPNTIIAGNLVDNATDIGIDITGAGSVKIENNVVENCRGDGIAIQNGDNCTILGNYVINNGEVSVYSYYGIWIGDSIGTIVEGNTVRKGIGNQKSGIWITNLAENTSVLNNDIENSGTVSEIKDEGTNTTFGGGMINGFYYLLLENSTIGDNTLTTDNWTFVIKLGKVASPTNWNVWAQVVDNSNAQDNEVFVNKFSVNQYLSVSYNYTMLSFSGLPNQTVGASQNPIIAPITSNDSFRIDVKMDNEIWTASGYGNIYAENGRADKDGSAPYDLTLSTSYQTLYDWDNWGEGLVRNAYWFLVIPNGTYNNFTNGVKIKIIQP